MGIPVKARHLPPRIATGAFILNSSVGKLSADDETAVQLTGFAAGAYPGLAVFSGGLLGLHARTPGMRKERSPFPTEQASPWPRTRG